MDDIGLAMDCNIYASGDIVGNRSKMLSSISSAKRNGCHVICFPEASLTGYSSTDPFQVDAGSEHIRMIAEASDGIAVVFGIFQDIPGGTAIRQVVCEDGDVVGVYTKTHLGMNEQGLIPGEELPVIDTAHCRLGIQICWELHFPEITGVLRSKGAELVLNPFASPISGDRRISIWRKLVPARADDNRLFYAACNSDGSSVICAGPDGNEIIGENIGGGLFRYRLERSLLDRYRNSEERMGNIDFPRHFRPELYRFEDL